MIGIDQVVYTIRSGQNQSNLVTQSYRVYSILNKTASCRRNKHVQMEERDMIISEFLDEQSSKGCRDCSLFVLARQQESEGRQDILAKWKVTASTPSSGSTRLDTSYNRRCCH